VPLSFLSGSGLAAGVFAVYLGVRALRLGPDALGSLGPLFGATVGGIGALMVATGVGAAVGGALTAIGVGGGVGVAWNAVLIDSIC
jgi:hypothetical protein